MPARACVRVGKWTCGHVRECVRVQAARKFDSRDGPAYAESLGAFDGRKFAKLRNAVSAPTDAFGIARSCARRPFSLCLCSARPAPACAPHAARVVPHGSQATPSLPAWGGAGVALRGLGPKRSVGIAGGTTLR